MAGCHGAPSSTETSTPATTPPPGSAAVPLIKIDPKAAVEPFAGETIVELGGVVSVDAAAVVRPLWRVVGCTPMSAKRLTVACCIPRSVVDPRFALSWLESSPHAHWYVPVANTRAPLGALYSVTL